MYVLYETNHSVEAVRLRHWLANHGVAAQVEGGAGGEEPSTAEAGIWRVMVDDASREAAAALLRELQSGLEDESDVSDASDRDSHPPPTRSEGRPSRLQRVPWLTLGYIGCCWFASVGLWQEPHPESDEALMRWGWRPAADVNAGAWWSIFTASLLHLQFQHLATDTFALLLIGWAIERDRGRWALLALALAGGLVCASADLATGGNMGIRVGGVVCCLLGFAVVARFHRPLAPVWLLVLLTASYGFKALITAAKFLNSYSSGNNQPFTISLSPLAGMTAGVLIGVILHSAWRASWKIAAMCCVALMCLAPLFGAPWSPEWLGAQASAAAARGDLARAVDYSTRAVERSGRRPETLVARGLIQSTAGALGEARRDFTEALRLDRRSQLAQHNLALLDYLESDLDGALVWTRAALSVPERTGELLVLRAEIRFSRGELASAGADFDAAVASETGLVDAFAARGTFLASISRFDDALRDVKRAVELDSDSAVAQTGFAFVQRLLGRRRLAARSLQSVENRIRADLDSFPRDPWILAQWAENQLAHYEVAGSPARLSAVADSIAVLLQVAPNYWNAWILKSGLELLNGEFQSAEQSADRAIELNPRDSAAYSLRAEARLALDRPDAAIADCRQCLQINERSAEVWEQSAKALAALGDLKEAVDYLDEAVRLNPRSESALRARGELWKELGELQRSQEDLDRAQQIEAAAE